MRIVKLLRGKVLAVALGVAMLPASIAIPQTAPLVGASIAVSEAQAQYYGGRHFRGDRGFYRGDRRWRGGRHHYRGDRYYRHRRGSDAGVVIGSAIAGLAVGAIIAGANQPRYVERRHYAPAPVYSYRPAPWTREWYNYCAQRYRSFDARSGTFQPYNGPRQICH